MTLAELPPNRFEPPDPFERLIQALETARREVCSYSPLARTCDCKYGLLPVDPMPTTAARCRHNNCEHNGCPDLRQMIQRVRDAQRQHIISCPGFNGCAHCGRTDDGRGGFELFARQGEYKLCHPNPDPADPDRPDCYHLATVYGHPVTGCPICWHTAPDAESRFADHALHHGPRPA